MINSGAAWTQALINQAGHSTLELLAKLNNPYGNACIFNYKIIIDYQIEGLGNRLLYIGWQFNQALNNFLQFKCLCFVVHDGLNLQK